MSKGRKKDASSMLIKRLIKKAKKNFARPAP
jgi:hypothetical protein